MGLPMIQVVVIAARQVSKPIADAVMRYGKSHPVFRQRILVPIGRYIVHMKTRLRMEKLGLGKPVTEQQVTEAVALEEATEAVQQLVIFSYSVGVYAAYWAYTTYTSEPTVKQDQFSAYQEEKEKEILSLRTRIETLEDRLQIKPKPEEKTSPTPTAPTQKEPEPSQKPWLQRVSSFPIDTATRLIYGKDEFVISRRDRSICIEKAHVVDSRGPLTFRKKSLTPHYPTKGLSRSFYNAASYVTGWKEWEY